MLEIIVETVADARAAEEGGATQLDLKCDFLEYGLTPSIGTLEQVRAEVDIDVLMMIRPYANGMVFSSDQITAMCTDIRLGAKFGASGFLLGALKENGHINKDAIRRFWEAADGLPLNFHIAWEMTNNPEKALEELIELGINSVRATGKQGLGGNASDGSGMLKQYHDQAAGRIDIFLAGGVNEKNITNLVLKTGIKNAHAGTSVRHPATRKGVVSAHKVRKLRSELDKALELLNLE